MLVYWKVFSLRLDMLVTESYNRYLRLCGGVRGLRIGKESEHRIGSASVAVASQSSLNKGKD